MRRHALVLITTWLCALAGAWAQTPATPAPAAWFTEADAQALEQALNEVLKDSSITAAQVALVDRDGVRFVRGLGRTKRDGGQPVDTRTLMRVGSVSKSITAFALARLVEQGKLQWDAPLAQIAPEVPFDNPYKATAPLRVVHLVEHTTGGTTCPMPSTASTRPTSQSPNTPAERPPTANRTGLRAPASATPTAARPWRAI
jgi:CubicO group peptidase (beta-lactamase class C family)